MGLFPSTRLGKVEFYEARVGKWTENSNAIGLSALSVSNLATLVADARAAFTAAEEARLASKDATAAFYNAVKAMHSGPGAGSDMVDTIRNFAATSDNPNVYQLASIPEPTSPSAAPPPGTPFDFTVGLLQDGSIDLKWKCNNPAGVGGTIYEVRRRPVGGGGGGGFSFVGASGSRRFIDGTIPSGSSGVTYQVTAVRSTVRGNPAQFNVNFGVGGDGVTFATITPNVDGVKIAA